MRHWLRCAAESATRAVILGSMVVWTWGRVLIERRRHDKIRRDVTEYELERLYPVEEYERYAPKSQNERLDFDRSMGMPIVRSLPPRQYQPK